MSGAQRRRRALGPGAQHDWELELAIVIGRHAHRVSREDAMEHVAGYTISNDVSTRDLMFRPNFSMTDFLMSKGRPGFFPTGPYIVPREFVEDYRQLRLTLRVNGEAMQDEPSTTSSTASRTSSRTRRRSPSCAPGTSS